LAGSLVPEADVTDAVIFGPVRCLGCSSRYPVNEGLIDFGVEPAKPSPLQQALELPWVARSWDRYFRPALDTMLSLSVVDRESEYQATRAMLGRVTGTLVDLGCGAGAFLLRLAKDFSEARVVGADMSRPMVEEAMALARENAIGADFVRAQVPPLPFLDHSLAAIVASGVVHYLEEVETLFAEVRRTLKPQGRFIASTYQSPLDLAPIRAGIGLYPRTEKQLEAATAKAGFIRFERVTAGPFIIWRCEVP
jgi:ubiquinone/menaquinone biosynthesis C-methylase UbiE